MKKIFEALFKGISRILFPCFDEVKTDETQKTVSEAATTVTSVQTQPRQVKGLADFSGLRTKVRIVEYDERHGKIKIKKTGTKTRRWINLENFVPFQGHSIVSITT